MCLTLANLHWSFEVKTSFVLFACANLEIQASCTTKRRQAKWLTRPLHRNSFQYLSTEIEDPYLGERNNGEKQQIFDSFTVDKRTTQEPGESWSIEKLFIRMPDSLISFCILLLSVSLWISAKFDTTKCFISFNLRQRILSLHAPLATQSAVFNGRFSTWFPLSGWFVGSGRPFSWICLRLPSLKLT